MKDIKIMEQKTWDELTREEKIDRLFELPEEDREEKAIELWGPETLVFSNTICFSFRARWNEIVHVLKKTGCEQIVQYHVSKEKFERVSEDHEGYHVYKIWLSYVLGRPIPLYRIKIELYNDDTLVSRLCIEKGEEGKPDIWVCALLDFNGRIIKPFSLGYIPDLPKV